MPRQVGSVAADRPQLTDRQLDKMVELHDRYKLSYRAIGVRYGIGEKMAQRMASKHRKGED